LKPKPREENAPRCQRCQVRSRSDPRKIDLRERKTPPRH
jgi:hypothetical protein